MFYCYILHSNVLNRFYTGSTILEPGERLERHLEKYYGNKKFTAKVSDWELFYFIEYTSKEQARKIECHIKKMKSKIYIQNLKEYPEMAQRLLEKFS
ncbi:MAG TPA: GIY-YIG nuclease family protein [Ignavibacteria bacterium]|nr:GIY-YIG nuclease family protein [Ignavibacteria bacterium]